MANEFIARNGLISLVSASITGSLEVSGKTRLAGIADQGSYDLQVQGSVYCGNSIYVAGTGQVSQSFSVGYLAPNLFGIFTAAGNRSPSAGSSDFISTFAGNFTEAPSGHHDILANVNIFSPSITGGAGTVGSYVCLYIGQGPGGTVSEDNYTAWFGGKVKIQSKLIGTGSGATIAAGAAAGTGPSVSVSGGDLAGVVSVTAGSATPAGTVVTVTFTSAFKNPPIVILSAANIDAASVVARMWTTSTTTTFTIEDNTNLANGTRYDWNYIVIGQ